MSGKIIIGITGEIGAGKTTFAEELAKESAHLIYADRIAHEVLKLQKVQAKLKNYFGEIIFKKGKLNLKKLATESFRNKENWCKLISSTHPYILRRIFKIIESSESRYFVIDAPLLFEAGLEDFCNYVIFIKAKKGIRKRRIKKLKWEEVERRNSYLLPSNLKQKLADFVIDNNKNKRRLKENAQKIWTRIKAQRK